SNLHCTNQPTNQPTIQPTNHPPNQPAGGFVSLPVFFASCPANNIL
ncbi:MAG TPA: hypothetical protein DEF92_04525, partial [Leclercia adecarboxylata]|nr:hypothetical protein [Leclercia adecarboxylata]